MTTPTTNSDVEKIADRPRSIFMDAQLEREHKVLDHGFIRVVDYMGNDSAVVQAARVSYGAGTKAVNEDRGLIRYLMSHRHSTPFEMAEIKLHVKLPVFVARQWIRHRTANVNEYSARYSILDREFYIPEVQNIAKQATGNKQGRDEGVDDLSAEEIRAILMSDANRSYDSYLGMIDEEGYGLARELARMNLPTNIYTQWYWKVDAHNLLHFLSLRADPHAQWEIRAYAEIMCDLVRGWMPHTFEAFEDYVMHAVRFSRQEIEALQSWMDIVRHAIDVDNVNGLPGVPEIEGLSKRELSAFHDKLGVIA